MTPCPLKMSTSMATGMIPTCRTSRWYTRTIWSTKSYRSLTRSSCRMSRRILVGIGALLFANPVLSLPQEDAKNSEIIRKLDNGVRIQDVIEGEGPEAHEGDLVEFNYVCRRSNGYFVHSTVDQFSGESRPVVLPLDEKQIIQGLKDVIVGMKAGGKRRALIPPNVGYVNENLKPIPEEFGPRRSLLSHSNEPLVFEVQLLKVL
ncbi:peptidyl-prolyl cis-trans isomerase FKBP16-1, chloroplastic isoform X1 [Canna indica]|uniref:peptidylprolyl isomerase n=1 Tax=Canna indica TaxID=4628 RepID=A0AAQ3Q8L8_9LILI|nr:peptidyl-prolyl cis-trans isomerase FKBP16-1, chloroplastic isoform X1 [Canna indica]